MKPIGLGCYGYKIKLDWGGSFDIILYPIVNNHTVMSSSTFINYSQIMFTCKMLLM